MSETQTALERLRREDLFAALMTLRVRLDGVAFMTYDPKKSDQENDALERGYRGMREAIEAVDRLIDATPALASLDERGDA